MIYYVSGYRRSGTSMMMACLERGGLEALYDPEQDRLIETTEEETGHKLNNSLYELDPAELQKPDFREQAHNKLVKLIAPGCAAHVMSGDMGVFMLRDYGEIIESHEASMLGTVMYSRDQFEETIAKTFAHLSEITGRRVIPFWYRAVVDSPLYHFRVLQAMGWPIDPEKCAEKVDPDMCRFKREAA